MNLKNLGKWQIILGILSLLIAVLLWTGHVSTGDAVFNVGWLDTAIAILFGVYALITGAFNLKAKK